MKKNYAPRKHLALAIFSPVLFSLIAIAAVLLIGQQPTATGPYIGGAGRCFGRTAYQANCAGCHGPDLGRLAMQRGATRRQPLYGQLGRGAPQAICSASCRAPCRREIQEASVKPHTLNIAAFILDSNGAPAGDTSPDDHRQRRHPLHRHGTIARANCRG